MRHRLVDMIARAEADAGSDEIHLLAQLRALVAAVELPTDRLFARYHGRPLGPSVYYADITSHSNRDPRGSVDTYRIYRTMAAIVTTARKFLAVFSYRVATRRNC